MVILCNHFTVFNLRRGVIGMELSLNCVIRCYFCLDGLYQKRFLSYPVFCMGQKWRHVQCIGHTKMLFLSADALYSSLMVSTLLQRFLSCSLLSSRKGNKNLFPTQVIQAAGTTVRRGCSNMLLEFDLLPANIRTGENAKCGWYSLSAARSTLLPAGSKTSSRSAKISLSSMPEEAPDMVLVSCPLPDVHCTKKADQSQAQFLLALPREGMMGFLVWIGQTEEGNSSWEGNSKHSVAIERTGFLSSFPALLLVKWGTTKTQGREPPTRCCQCVYLYAQLLRWNNKAWIWAKFSVHTGHFCPKKRMLTASYLLL